MKRVCVVTATRSEYGLMRWFIDSIYHDEELELQLVVTGAHLSLDQGMTYKFIEEDGYPISEKVPMLLSCNDEIGIVKSMGVCSISIVDTFNRLKPDVVVVLGDRYELIPIVSAALIMRIPVAHIGGGDITEGAVDDEVRNAVTMMATLHFPGTKESANNIIRMRGSEKMVFEVGEPGLDAFKREVTWSKEETAKMLNLDLKLKWSLVTLHPETKLSLDENVQMTNNLCNALYHFKDCQFVITYANADAGGSVINKLWADFVKSHPDNFQLYPSLGRERYLNYMKYVNFVIGNSSSGIIEAPLLGTPVVNIGDRQKGRHLCSNIVNCGRTNEEMINAIEKAMMKGKIVDDYWGDGESSNRIYSMIKDYLYETE